MRAFLRATGPVRPCRRATWLFLVALACSGSGTVASAAPGTGSDVLARSMAIYPKLTSYADTGTVVQETTGGNWERYKFKTHFRKNSDYFDLYFDFQGVNWKSGELVVPMPQTRKVLWMTNGELQSFDQESKLHESFSRESGRHPGVLTGAVSKTRGASILIFSLIFAKSNLPGTVLQIQESSDAGFEMVNGHRCHKVVGMAAAYYPSGQITNVRQVTVWIDEKTLLIRKVLEDTPKGYPAGGYSRVIVTLDPQANPTLDDSKFQFKVPTFQ